LCSLATTSKTIAAKAGFSALNAQKHAEKALWASLALQVKSPP
jgi:hypothetical protein